MKERSFALTSVFKDSCFPANPTERRETEDWTLAVILQGCYRATTR